MNKARKIAVVGATGMVGKSFLNLLEKEYFQDSEITLLASANSAGREINFRGKIHQVNDLANHDFSYTDLALFSAGSSVASTYAPIAKSRGCVVVDNSSCFRYTKDIPLIVPEVNSKVLDNFKSPGIIANPNCSTIQMLVALKPLHDEFIIERVDVTTFQAVSGTGKKATEELIDQLEAYRGNKIINSSIYSKPIANNALPHCGDFEDNSYTEEENKLVKETQKILDPNIKVSATCVRVPVLNGHSESVHIKTKKPIAEDLAVKLLKEAPGLSVKYEKSRQDYPTAFTDGDGDNLVHVGRIRKDLWEENRLNLWIVADNLLKGAALNSIQIATLLFD